MKDMPAREKLDIAEKVAQYLVLAGTLDKTSPHEDYERANELSLELAMLLPVAIYRSMVDAAVQPNAKVNPASVALMMRRLLASSAGEEDELQPMQVAVHAPGGSGAPVERSKSRAH